ncbi:MAG: hypothetical protein KGL39_25220 [Patescibacteria group bacterium]|nr:hypothetical protein [Patescibacteria group bacterium]
MKTGRQRLTPRERAAILARQGGTCVVRGCGETRRLQGEHTIPNHFKPGKPDALMCPACHSAKTKRDRKDIAHVDRLNGTTSNQFTRRAKRHAKGLRPLLQTNPMLAGRGFDTTKTRGLDGKVRDRRLVAPLPVGPGMGRHIACFILEPLDNPHAP